MKTLYLYPLYVLSLVSCSETILEEKCPDVICTQEFRSLSIKFKDASGTSIAVKDFNATIRRTGKSTIPYPEDAINNKGIYTIVTDRDTKQLSTTGDTIDVSATNPQTNQKKVVQFVVSGGKCACHIQKISGVEEVVFD